MRKTRKGCCRPDLVVLDFDGVLTDNRVLVMENGTEGVFCNRADGLGVRMLKYAGIKVIILSTEKNKVVLARGKKLKVPVIQAVADKAETLRKHCMSEGIELGKVLYIGNDVNDLAVMKIVGYPVAVGDANPLVKAIAWRVTLRKGGEGVVQELAESVLGLKYSDSIP